MSNVERIIREVNGSMSIEGMPLTEDDKNRIRTCIADRSRVDEMVKLLVAKHTVKESDDNAKRL